jgi:predicted RNase H-like nuclease
MPLGLLAAGWRVCDRAAARLLGPRRSSVFAIPPRPVWEQQTYAAANALCKELTGKGMSAESYGLRAMLLEANAYRETCGYPLHEVHPELAFAAMAGAPLADRRPAARRSAARRPGAAHRDPLLSRARGNRDHGQRAGGR